MKIACPACLAKYSIADEKVQNRLAKIRCRKCGTTIVIDGKVEPPNVYAADQGATSSAHAQPEPAAGGAAEYSVDFGDNDQRTLSLDALVAAYNTGEVTADTYVWADGMPDWQPLGEVPEIVDALNAAAGAAASEPPPDPGAGVPVGGGMPWGEQQPAEAVASDPRPAARSGGRTEGASDLFGGFDAAGSEDEVMTSAPQEAPGSAPQPTGARNESSVLFSLSALTASRASEPPPAASPVAGASSGSATKDDSGLIDLKALTSEARPDDAGAGGVAAFSPGGLSAPLGMAAPLGGTAAEAVAAPSMPPPQKSRAGLYIGGGIVAAALVIGAAIIFTRPSAPPPEERKAEQPVATQTAAAAQAPTPTVTAKPPATGTAEPEEDEKEVAKKAVAARPVARKVAAAPAAKKASSTALKSSTPSKSSSAEMTSKKKTTPKKKSSSRCKCKPGDLMCAMRCASKR